MTIPLTFDWLTVAWLKIRLHMWWRTGRVSPRQLAWLLLLGVFSGCVPVTRFEETQSAAQVESEGRRRSEYQVAQLKAENAELRGRVQQQGDVLEAREQALSQAQLDSTTLSKEREDSQAMVEQLRRELTRLGGHLQTFHEDQQRLEATVATEAARGRELSRLSRDAALALVEPIATGEYTLDPEQGALVLRVPRDKVLADDGSVKTEAEPLLKVVARLLQLHKQTKLRVDDSSMAADPLATSRLVAALGERGVAPERFEPVAVKANAGTEPPPKGAAEIELAFSVP